MKRLITLVALSLFAAGAHANGAFSHLDISFLQSDLEVDGGGETDGDGIGVEFNGGFLGKTFFAIEHTARNYDTNSSLDLDFKLTEFGLGYKILGDEGGLMPYAGLNFYNAQLGSQSDEGLSGQIGVRYGLSEQLVVGARYKIFKSDDSDTDDNTSFRVSGTFALTPVFGLLARYESFSEDSFDVNEFSIGFRAIFGGGDE